MNDFLHVNIDRASRATDKFITDYCERMRYPVSQLYSVVGETASLDKVNQTDLDVLNRIIKDINVILTDLMENLEREGNPEELQNTKCVQHE